MKYDLPKPFIQRVLLHNYKSIEDCSVRLDPLTFLVGPNGAGKSNFLDSFKFVADSLILGLENSLLKRGSIKEVRRRSSGPGHPRHFAIRLDFNLADGASGHYSFLIGSKPGGGIQVQQEECKVVNPGRGNSPLKRARSTHFFRVSKGEVVANSEHTSPATPDDRLALVNFSGDPAFRPVYDALTRIEVYNVNPKEIAIPHTIGSDRWLRSDGSNAASMLRHTPKKDAAAIVAFLSEITPRIVGVRSLPVNGFETLLFLQSAEGPNWRFPPTSVSDGTLRSFGILLAALQEPRTGPMLVGLEEPESAVHPAAARVLLRALRQASEDRQILVTSHSPDLLDDPDLPASSLVEVENHAGVTSIGPLDRASQEMLRKRLFTTGELLRQNQLKILKEPGDTPNLVFFDVKGAA